MAQGLDEAPATLAVRSGERRLRAHRGAGPPRVRGGQAGALPPALVAQGAAAARRGGGRADRGPEIEHGLVELPGAPRREQAIGQGLGLAQCQTRSRHAARQDADHVGVDRRHIGLEGEGEHRPRRVGADPRQGAQRGLVGGNGATVLAGDGRRRPVQIERPAVVAQARPEPHHVAGPGPGAVDGAGVRPEERLVVADDPVHLGLLQHDLADQHPPRVAGAAPREVAAVGGAPVQYPVLETPDPGRRRRVSPRRRRRRGSGAPARSPASTP